MGIQVGDNFDHKSKKPLDGRTQYADLATMKAVTDANIPEGCLAYCVATDKYYKFLSTNTVDESTGKWREFSSGGSGGAEIDDTTTAADKVWSSQKTNTELGLKQPKVLETPITINGTQYTTVEAVLNALNATDTELAYTDVTGRIGVNHFTFDDPTLVDVGKCKIFICRVGSYYGDTNLPHDSSMPVDETKLYIVKMLRAESPGYWFSQECWVLGSQTNFVRTFARQCFYTNSTWTFNTWVEIGAGGGDDANAYHTTDTAETTLADEDYFPFYDTSATAKKKTLWSNVKSVLKTYFDTLYNKVIAGTGLNLTSGTMSIKEFESGDMEEVMSPLPSVQPRCQKYSTEEQIVGEWIDGKPLYQRTLTGTWSSSTSTETKSISVGNVHLIDWFGECEWYENASSYGTMKLPQTYQNGSTTSYCFIGFMQGNNFTLTRVGNLMSIFASQNFTVTLRYTKN